MHFDFNLSDTGHEIALMALAWNVGNAAAAKCLGEINAEKKAAQDTTGPEPSEAPAIDRFSDFANDIREEELQVENLEEQGLARTVGFVEYCVLLAAINDKLTALAQGKTWPRPQSIEALVDWKTKATPGTPRPNQVAEMRAMLEAYNGGQGVNLSDEEIDKLVTGENQNRAEFFANLFIEHRQDIIDRMEAGCLNYNRFSEASWESLFNNLPPRIKYSLLGSIDFRLQDKCDELLTGKLRNGVRSAGASRPMLVRAAEISVLRADQKVLGTYRQRLESQLAA